MMLTGRGHRIVQGLAPPAVGRRANVHRLRVSPDVYTAPAGLDRFVAAVVRAVQAGGR